MRKLICGLVLLAAARANASSFSVSESSPTPPVPIISTFTLNTTSLSSGSTTTITGEMTFPSKGKGEKPTARVTYREGLARAWAVFNGMGSATLDDGYNVTSVTRNGVGDYSLAFATPFATGYYACTGTAQRGASGDGLFVAVKQGAPPTPGSINVTTLTGAGTNEDATLVMLACYGRQ